MTVKEIYGTDFPIILAPMAGITDLPFRILCKEQGADVMVTEMISAKALFYGNKNTLPLMQTEEEEKPIGVQIFGSEPELMGEMAHKIEDKGFSYIDINMGCPVPKIVNNKEGSALMLNPELAGRIVKEVSKAVSLPVTVKFRKGFDDQHLNALEIGRIAEESGAKAVTIHGRTREQYYAGKADWDIIKALKEEIKTIPVIGNGDIFTPEDAKKMLEYTGCDAVMIGRGSQGNPFIFKRTVEYLENGVLLPEPTWEDRLDIAEKHMDMLADYKGEVIGIREMRKHLGWYIKGLPHSAEMRVKINATSGRENMRDVLNYMRELIASNNN